MPLDTHDIQLLDPDYKRRADALIHDALLSAKRTKIGPALKGWWRDKEFVAWGGESAIKVATGVGVMCAAAAIGAAGVATAAVTFGIGPAIGIVAGIAVAKGVQAVTYARHETKLRRGILYGTLDVLPLGLLPVAVDKILKKYLRAARRGKMLMGDTTLQKVRGAAYNVRHPVTTARSAYKNLTADSNRGSGELVNSRYATDVELEERLQELRYYGQMTFNSVDEHLETLMDRRAQWAEFADHLYAHVVRQVHFTGNHERCSTFCCYGLSMMEFHHNKQRIKAKLDLEWTLRGSARPLVREQGKDALRHLDVTPNQARTPTGQIGAIPPPPPPRDDATATSDGIDPWGTTKDVGGDRLLEYGVQTSGDLASNLAKFAINKPQDSAWRAYAVDAIEQHSLTPASNKVAEVFTGVSPGAVATGAIIGIALDQIVMFGRERYRRRKVATKLQALRNNVVARAIEGDAELARKEFMKEIDNDNKAAMPRVAVKTIHYLAKIDELESDPSWRTDVRVITQMHDFDRVVFKDCGHAWDTVKATLYLIRQYEKAITAAIYEQLLLLQLDRKLADHGLSKMPGTLIRDGAPTPLRPQHMRADATGSWWIFRSGEDDDIELDEGALPDMS